MDYTQFFEKNDQLAFQILQKFAIKRNSMITVSSILDQFPVSEYKLTTILASLNNDLMHIQYVKSPKITETEKNVLRGQNITTTVVNEIRLLYLQRSVLFAVFKYNFLQSKKIPKAVFMKSNYISKTKFYASEIALRDILKNSDFYQSPNITSDDEYILRLNLFEFFYTAFNGIGSPFQNMNIQTNNLIVRIQEQFAITNKPVQKSKLEIFLKIWLLRMENGHYIGTHIISTDNVAADISERLTSIGKYIRDTFKLSLGREELNYLYTFLLTQEYIGGIQNVLHKADVPLAYQLTTKLIERVTTPTLLIDPDAFESQALFLALIQINLRFTMFYIEPTTFISLNQIDFFKETYPLFHAVINQFIEDIKHEGMLKLNPRESANLYFDYMFALINSVPKSLLLDKVHICVDFSQGKIYNTYITETLEGFANANIVIESNLSHTTDIYLSDFYSTAVKKSQTIWRNPPSPDDWAALGDNIIKLKHMKVQQLVNEIQRSTKGVRP